MTPDIKLNGTSVASMGWLRETISFPLPQSQTNTIIVPGRNSPIRYTEALAYILSASELLFDVFHAGNKKNL